MKQRDVLIVVAIAFISAVVSYVASNKIFASPANREQEVQIVSPITANFPQPNPAYFNSSAIDPTQPITITQNSNTDPFNGSTSQ